MANTDGDVMGAERRVRRARLAVSAVFFLNGVVIGSWVARIPAIQERLRLSEGGLGLVLLWAAVGALLAMPISGMLVARYGSRPVMLGAAASLCAALPLLALAPNPALLGVALALLGATNAVTDVAMNAHAVVVEERYGRPVMSSFHGLWSVGGLVGAVAGGAAAARGVAPGAQFLAASLLLLVVLVLASRGLLPGAADRGQAGAPAFARPTRALLGLGLVAFCAMLAEGAMSDWSAVYLERVLRTGPGFAAAGYAGFSLAMAVGRLAGDGLNARVGPVALVRGGGVLTVLGLAGGLLAGHPVAAVLGFGCVGAGLSIIVPVAFSAAGRTPGVSPGPALGAVATTGYTGFLVGPPAIGLGAEATSLPVALGMVALLGVVIVALAGSVARGGAAQGTGELVAAARP